ncbi:MAG: hypothetical protein L6R40_000030 [Gallowayella cf. fulva]|nr:MAG: hypothetical protein L6R40_000030 [Xanthomendoza cf. fulva]
MRTPTADGTTLTIPLRPGSDHNGSQPALPPPPTPSADPSLVPQIISPTKTVQEPNFSLPSDDIDIFKISVSAALKLLCGTVEALIQITGDVPPTPPVSVVQQPRPRVVSLGIENQRPHSRSSSVDRRRSQPPPSDEWSSADNVPEKAKTPIGSPEAKPAEPLQAVDGGPEPLDIQLGAVARKFYSKVPPPIPLAEYLLRLQRYCPMSTGVYLAASFYIYQIAVVQRSIPVTVRNAHRLLLGALRVAGKAVDDTNFRHKRFAHVGGVTEPELGRLEIAFCFLTNFDLRVTAEMLQEHVRVARDTRELHEKMSSFKPKTPLLFDKKSTAAARVRKESADVSTKAQAAA